MTDALLEARIRESFDRQGLMRTFGASVFRVAAGFCELRCDVSDALTQQNGAVHAGVLTALADTAGGYAALTVTGEGEDVLSVEFKLNFLEPVRGTGIIARGSVLRGGRRLVVCQIEALEIRDGKDTLCATGLQTVVRVAPQSHHPR